jgi:hypothetical protein
MAKLFEDYFSELQADMISVCREYVQNKADNIFVHCLYEAGVSTCNVFYKINGTVVKRSKVNDALTTEEKRQLQYDVSDERQKQLIHIINDDIAKIATLCKQYSRSMPVEMKLIYDVGKNNMKANYVYDSLYTNNPDKNAKSIFNDWFEEINQTSK